MINAEDVFETFQKHRGDAIVIATGTSGTVWRSLSTNQRRDLTLGSTMGQTSSSALGFALAQPAEKVVFFDSEGSLLMNLGNLATIAGKKPENFFHFLMDNECYATTGGQPVPNATDIDYAEMALGAGYASAHSFDNLEDFATNVGEILKETGPVFVALKIVPRVENMPVGLRVRQPALSRAETIKIVREELGISAD